MIVLHHVSGARSMRVLWLLHELGEPFELTVRAYDASLQEPEHLVVSPAGRVPALHMDGESYFESGALIEILCERFPRRGLGRLPGDLDRPDWLVWLNFAETVSHHAVTLLKLHAIAPEAPAIAEMARSEVAALRRCLAAIEGRLSTPVENRDYILTSGFSAVDIALGQAVWMARHFTDFDGLPEVGAWYERITTRESFALSRPEPGRGMFEEAFYSFPGTSDDA